MFKKLLLIVLLVFFCLMLFGCSWFNSTNTIQTNQYYQTDYNYFCYDEGKTWSQIVVCLTAEGKAERTQNQITNDLLSQN